jgi:hypothetical protein
VVSEQTQSWFQDLVTDARRRLGDLNEIGRHPQQFHGRAVLEDEGIEAVVAPGGAPVSLVLGQRSLRLEPEVLAERILHAQRLALHEANRRCSEAIAGVRGFGGAEVASLLGFGVPSGVSADRQREALAEDPAPVVDRSAGREWMRPSAGSEAGR